MRADIDATRAVTLGVHLARVAERYMNAVEYEEMTRDAWTRAYPDHKPLEWDKYWAARCDRVSLGGVLAVRIDQFNHPPSNGEQS